MTLFSHLHRAVRHPEHRAQVGAHLLPEVVICTVQRGNELSGGLQEKTGPRQLRQPSMLQTAAPARTLAAQACTA